MNRVIGTTLIKHLRPAVKTPYDVRDERLRGFMLRVQPSGVKSYLVEFARGKREVIGRVGEMEPDAAREIAKAKLYSFRNPYANNQSTGNNHTVLNEKIPTFREFITEHYEAHALIHMKSGKNTLERLTSSFDKRFAYYKLVQIDLKAIDNWISAELKRGIKPSTINRRMTDLQAAMNKAVLWELIPFNPLKKFKRLKEDTPEPRFLTPTEEKSLRATLDLQPKSSYIRPLVLLALNTGLRLGTLLSLTWDRVILEPHLNELLIPGRLTKSGRLIHIPLNSEAIKLLEDWRVYADGEYVFHYNGKPIKYSRRIWAKIKKKAGIVNLRFHDLRHTFASKLVMSGVDLNTVRELLDHAEFKTTLKYAHLAPGHKLDAVEKLVNKG